MSSNVLDKIDNGERQLNRELNVEVGDYIFINSAGNAAKANASSINTMPCVGRVVRIQGSKCFFKKSFIENAYADIAPREVYFISDTEDGELMDEAPTNPMSVIQSVGYGINDDNILVDINPSNVIIRS